MSKYEMRVFGGHIYCSRLGSYHLGGRNRGGGMAEKEIERAEDLSAELIKFSIFESEM